MFKAEGSPAKPLFSLDAMKQAALRHLDRYAASEADLRRVLRRRVERMIRRVGPDDPDAAAAERAAGLAFAEEAVAVCLRLGLLDDRRYAEIKVVSGRRRGWSRRRIAASLGVHGVDEEVARAALEEADPGAGENGAEEGDPDLAAARRTVRRRRLGAGDDPDDCRRALQRLVRAGFSLKVARAALAEEAKAEEDEEEEI